MANTGTWGDDFWFFSDNMAGKLKYSVENMLKAIEAVNNGSSIKRAAKSFNVPRTTLSDKVRGKTPIDRKMGPQSILSPAEENILEDWILHLASRRFPVTRDQLLDSVQALIKKLGKPNPFTNNRPGRHWYDAFLKRHPNISQRTAQNLTSSRSAVTEKNIRAWFEEVEQYMRENQIFEVLNEPTRVFNCDETAFFLNPSNNRVLAKKGQKTVHSTVGSDEKECLTTLLMANAAGDVCPAMVVVDLKRVPKKFTESVPKSWAVGRSDNGWMTGETFFEYFANIFYPWLLENKVIFPVVVFLDGHASHLTMALSDFCKQKCIELVALFPNSTQILQPMDVAVFHPLKNSWKKAVSDWRMKNYGIALKRDNFCPILEKVVTNTISRDMLKNGFRCCGLCPFNPNSIDYTKLSAQAATNDKSTITINSTDDPAESLKKYEENLLFFENEISPVKLAEFKEGGSHWTGRLEDSGLFNYWLHLKNKISEFSQDHNGNRISRENIISPTGKQLSLQTIYLFFYTIVLGLILETPTAETLGDDSEVLNNSFFKSIMNDEDIVTFTVDDDGFLQNVQPEKGLFIFIVTLVTTCNLIYCPLLCLFRTNNY